MNKFTSCIKKAWNSVTGKWAPPTPLHEIVVDYDMGWILESTDDPNTLGWKKVRDLTVVEKELRMVLPRLSVASPVQWEEMVKSFKENMIPMSGPVFFDHGVDSSSFPSLTLTDKEVEFLNGLFNPEYDTDYDTECGED